MNPFTWEGPSAHQISTVDFTEANYDTRPMPEMALIVFEESL